MNKRLGVELALTIAIMILFGTDAYTHLPPPLQFLALKIITVSMAILHAHLTRKLLFTQIDWSATKLTGRHYVAIVFYIVVPICYTLGG